MWAVAGELAAIFVLANLPTPLYVIYRQAFGFSQLTLTIIYAAYVVGTLTTLLFLGRLSDQVGRRKVVLGALALAALSAVLFLVANGTAWLLVARVASGLSIALASGASTAWILELHPRGDTAGATQIAIGANAIGLAIGPLLAGFLAEYAPAPLRLPYVVFFPLLLAATLAIGLSGETLEQRKPVREASVRPKLGVPRQTRADFVTPAIAAFVTFAVLGFFSALIPSMLEHALHVTNHAVAGGIVGALFLVVAAAIATSPDWKPRTGMIAGLLLLLPGTVLLVIAEHAHSMALLLVATALTGLASGIGYRFGLQVVNEIAPEDRRAQMVSTYLMVCYAAISLPVIGIGIVATIATPLLADTIFGGLIALLTIGALIFELRPSRRRRARA